MTKEYDRHARLPSRPESAECSDVADYSPGDGIIVEEYTEAPEDAQDTVYDYETANEARKTSSSGFKP